MNILFQLSGSIACYKSCDFISFLLKENHKVKVVATEAALKFVGEATLEGLTGERVITDSFQKGFMMSHIELSRWCDKAILCPATAYSINGLAKGVLKNIIGDIFLAFPFKQKPYYIVPAMNSFMLSHPTVRQSLLTLNSFEGVFVFPTEKGILACKEEGYGKLLSISKIYERIFRKKKAKILITGGATEEPIDSVRYLTNKSTGKTATFLAEKFHKEGYDVTFLKSKRIEKRIEESSLRQISFTSFKNLDKRLKHLLSSESYDFVFHLAAVSDYSLEKPQQHFKIDSSSENLHLKLKRNKKILEFIKSYSLSQTTKVIGYKLTVKSEGKKEVERIFSQGGVDYVVHNDLLEMTDRVHPFSLYNVKGKTASGQSKGDMYEVLKGVVDASQKEKECDLMS